MFPKFTKHIRDWMGLLGNVTSHFYCYIIGKMNLKGKAALCFPNADQYMLAILHVFSHVSS
jgi:hypothetical protein